MLEVLVLTYGAVSLGVAIWTLLAVRRLEKRQ